MTIRFFYFSISKGKKSFKSDRIETIQKYQNEYFFNDKNPSIQPKLIFNEFFMVLNIVLCSL